MEIEFNNQNLKYKSQPVVNIFFKNNKMNKIYQPDFLCFDEVIVEIKAINNLSGNEESQIINYLKATKLKVGLLINFGLEKLQYKRFVYNYYNYLRKSAQICVICG